MLAFATPTDLATALRRAHEVHHAEEQAGVKHTQDWPEWYADFIFAPSLPKEGSCSAYLPVDVTGCKVEASDAVPSADIRTEA